MGCMHDFGECDTQQAQNCQHPCDNGQAGDCKCIFTDYGAQCVECPLGHVFSDDDPSMCIVDDLCGKWDTAMHDQCQQMCDDSPMADVCQCFHSLTGAGECSQCPEDHKPYGHTGVCVHVDDTWDSLQCQSESFAAYCQESCSLQENPDGDCRCINQGSGDNCVHCPPGHVFDDSGDCVPGLRPCSQDDITQCNQECGNWGQDADECYCDNVGWGPECRRCVQGSNK